MYHDCQWYKNETSFQLKYLISVIACVAEMLWIEVFSHINEVFVNFDKVQRFKDHYCVNFPSIFL